MQRFHEPKRSTEPVPSYGPVSTLRKRLQISGRTRRDLVILAVSTFTFWLVALKSDLAEHVIGYLEHLSVGHEHTLLEIDEILLSFVFGAFGLALFSWRRWHDLRTEAAVRMRVEENLLRRQEHLQSIVDQIPVMIVFIDPEGRTEWVNPEWERVLGWSLGEVRRQSPLSHMYPDPEVRNEVTRFALAGERTWREFTTRTRRGEAISTIWSNVVLSDGSSIGFGQDVTWRKRSLETLRRFGERLTILHDMDRALLTETTPQTIASATLSRLSSMLSSQRASIVVFSPGLETGTILAVDPDEEIHLDVGANPPMTLFGPLDQLREGNVHEVEDIETDLSDSPAARDLRSVGVRSYSNVPLIAKGKLIGVLNVGRAEPGEMPRDDLEVIREVADSVALAVHQANIFEALAASEEKYHALYSSIREGVAIFEPVVGDGGEILDYEFADVNPAFTDHTGLHTEEIRGRRAGEIWQEPPFLETFSRVLETGRSERFQRYLEPIGRQLAASAFALPNGRFAALFTDVTEEHRTAIELERYRKRLELLYGLSQHITQTLDPGEVANRAIDTLRSITGAERGNVVLLDPSVGTLEILALSGDHHLERPAQQVALDRLPGFGALGWVGRHRQALLLNDVTTDPRWEVVPGVGEDTRAFLGAPLLVDERLLGVIALASGRAEHFDEGHLKLVESAAASVAAAIDNSRLFEAAEHHRKELQTLSARMGEVEESERRRLSRDLHDMVGQSLTVLAINLNLVRTSVNSGDTARANERLDDSLVQVNEVMECIRDVISELRPPLLDDEGLVAALGWYAELYEKRTGILARVEAPEAGPPLEMKVRSALFRIVQEALTNVAKHSGADTASVELTTAQDRLRLTIADDGVGFDAIAPSPGGPRLGQRPGLGLGLVDMRERAQAIGARLEIDSAPGRGTRVIVDVGRGA